MARKRAMDAASGAVAVLVVFLMAVSGASAGSVSAPYKGAVVNKILERYVQGCYVDKTLKTNSFSKSTGLSAYAETNRGTSCMGALGNILATNDLVQVGYTVLVPIKIPAGPHSVTVLSAEKFVMNSSVSPMVTCPATAFSYIDSSNGSYDYNGSSGSCDVQSVTEITAVASVYDVTNDTYIALGPYNVYNLSEISNYTDIYWACYGPAYGYSPACQSSNSTGTTSETYNGYNGTIGSATALGVSVNSAITSSTSYTFAAHHSYYLVWEISATTYTSILAPSGVGYASVNYGTGGNGIKLTGIQIS